MPAYWPYLIYHTECTPLFLPYLDERHGCDRAPAESHVRLALHGLQGPSAPLTHCLQINQGEIA